MSLFAVANIHFNKYLYCRSWHWQIRCIYGR